MQQRNRRQAAVALALSGAALVAGDYDPPVWRVAYTVEAWDTDVRDGKLLVVDSDAAHLRAIEIPTGKELWRAPLGGSRVGAVIHDLDGDRVLVQSPGQYVTIDTKTGQVVATRPGPEEWTFVWRRSGACGLRRRCALEPISCADGHALAAPIAAPPPPYSFHDEYGVDDSCSGTLDPVGRAGDLSLYAVGADVVAIDDAGKTRWTAPVGCTMCVALGSGVSTDGSTCWTTGYEGDDALLRTFDCKTGAAGFTRKVDSKIVTGWTNGSLFVSGPTTAVLLGPDGTERWSMPVSAGTLVVPQGLRVPDYPLGLDGYGRIAYVRADSGEVVASNEGPVDPDDPRHPAQEIAIRSSGAIYLRDPGGGYDRAGNPTPPVSDAWRASPQLARLHVETFEKMPGVSELVLVERREGKPDRIHVLAH